MTGTAENPRAVIGDNSGEPDALVATVLEGFEIPKPEVVEKHLQDSYAKWLAEGNALYASTHKIPEKVDTDELAAKMADFYEQIRDWIKRGEDYRTVEKAAFQGPVDAVQTYFVGTTSNFVERQKLIKDKVRDYMEGSLATKRAMLKAAVDVAQQTRDDALTAHEANKSDLTLKKAYQQAEKDLKEAQKACKAKTADVTRVEGETFGTTISISEDKYVPVIIDAAAFREQLGPFGKFMDESMLLGLAKKVLADTLKQINKDAVPKSVMKGVVYQRPYKVNV